MNIGRFLKSVVKAAAPIVKVALPVVITAVVTHQSAKAAALNVVRAELGR